MLKVNIELHPHGNSDNARVISSFFIANDGTGTFSHGNYLFKKNEEDKWEPSIQEWPRVNPVEHLVQAVIHKHYD